MTYPSERNQDAWRDANRANALTQAEVQALPVGTAVAIVWSGGNGPARYVIDEQSEEFGTYVRVEGMEHWADRGRVRDPVSFVGPERFHTHVVMAEQEGWPSPSAEFAARLHASMTKHKTVLDRLADAEQGSAGYSESGEGT